MAAVKKGEKATPFHWSWGRALRRLGPAVFVVLVLTVVLAPAAPAAFPGDNGRILFVKNARNSSPLYSVNPDGSRLRKITRGRYDDAPSVAPNGRKITFAREAHDGSAIFSVHMNGRHLKRLTRFGDRVEPAFSGPLGRRIAFTDFGTRFPQIWLMASDGTKGRRVTHGRTVNRSPTFSPDGNWIAFERPATPGEIYKMRPDGSDLRRLTHSKRSNNSPSYSPDGRSIVFNRSSNGGEGVVYLMRADGTHVRRVLRGWDPTFSPNGKRIAFELNGVIYTVDRRGRDQRRVTPRSWGVSRPDWAVRTGTG
jgi:Tol biopolymer transport system component